MTQFCWAWLEEKKQPRGCPTWANNQETKGAFFWTQTSQRSSHGHTTQRQQRLFLASVHHCSFENVLTWPEAERSPAESSNLRSDLLWMASPPPAAFREKQTSLRTRPNPPIICLNFCPQLDNTETHHQTFAPFLFTALWSPTVIWDLSAFITFSSSLFWVGVGASAELSNQLSPKKWILVVN